MKYQEILRTSFPASMGFLCMLGLLAAMVYGRDAEAEPYLAVKTGLKCATCHVNATGGGLRTPFGNQWAKNNLPANDLQVSADAWTGQLSEHFATGGNLRGVARSIDIPNADGQNELAMQEARVYLDFSPVPGWLDVYIDQNVAPGGSLNREAYLRYWSADHDWYVKAGQMYLPYGWRLEDDTAFIRQAPGINMTTPDNGIEFGWEKGQWSTQLAVSNGTAGGAEIDTGKQFSLRTERVFSGWRAGASVNYNNVETGSREMMNLFAGLSTGPVAWLAEIDRISDDTLAGAPVDQDVALLEANWSLLKGHNLKITGEYLDPNVDIDDDEQNRISLVWEYSPVQFMQLRVGARSNDGPAVIDIQNRSELFVQWHGYY